MSRPIVLARVKEAWTKESFKKHLDSEILYANKRFDRWREERLDKDPCRAFESSLDTFEDTAVLRVFGLISSALEKETTSIESIHVYAKREMFVHASSPTRSSSPTVNLMAQCLLSAWARIVEGIEEG